MTQTLAVSEVTPYNISCLLGQMGIKYGCGMLCFCLQIERMMYHLYTILCDVYV